MIGLAAFFKLFIWLDGHPHFEAFGHPGHENCCLASFVLNQGVTVGFFHSKQVPKSRLLVDYLIDIIVVSVNSWNAFEQTGRTWEILFVTILLSQSMDESLSQL